MRSSTVLFSILPLLQLGAASVLKERAAGCSANNCLRALRGKGAEASADCSSFLLATVTPATATQVVPSSTTLYQTITITTTTVTEFSIVPDTNTVIKKRQATVIPTKIPTYATACAGASAYSSACSCISVHPSTITAAPPLVTVTSVATETSISTVYTQATTTIAVCDPANDYDYFFDSSTADLGFNQHESSQYYPQLDRGACCRQCYNQPGCFTYRMTNQGCLVAWYTDHGTNGPSNPMCPGLGSGDVVVFPPFTGVKTAGIGPCVVRPYSTQTARPAF